ncbi:MAG TPA: chaperone modulator CbpM [Terriglobia bacterium]|nr:chaperone modulator CbpM [Terriglobia bacterium]
MRPRRDLLPLKEVASRAGVHPDVIYHFIELGLIEPATDRSTAEILLDPEAIHRVCVIQRLRGDLGVNLAGAGVILDLLDRLSASKRGGNRGYK